MHFEYLFSFPRAISSVFPFVAQFASPLNVSETNSVNYINIPQTSVGQIKQRQSSVLEQVVLVPVLYSNILCLR